ncbi:unnamed protein product [Camellia sinensis]
MEMEIQLTFRRPLQSTPLFIDQEMQAALLGNRPNIHRRSEIMGNPLDMTEMMIVREMEKRRIRDEILTAEQLLRWRELEGEVVREIMMERDFHAARQPRVAFGRGFFVEEAGWAGNSVVGTTTWVWDWGKAGDRVELARGPE